MAAIEPSPTLADLYPKNLNLAFVGFPQSSNIDLTPTLTRNRQFLFRGREEFASRLPLRIKFLSLVSQQFAFTAGAMPVLVLDHDPLASASRIEKDREQIRRNLRMLKQSSQPDLHFFAGPADIPRDLTLAMTLPIDILQNRTQLFDMETHYELLSRKGLADSGLDTPETTHVFQPLRMPEMCCSHCSESDAISDKCSGARSSWLVEQSDNVASVLRQHELPFVMKFQHSYSGGGVFLVPTEEARRELLDDISNILKTTLPKLTEHNEHLRPVDISFTEMITDVASNSALTFFVKADGEGVWFCVSQQHVDSQSQYTGSTVIWSQQSQLQAKFDSLMQRTSTYLHGKGYIGPVGADVLEDSAGNMYIVDLNVRATTSTVMGPLKSFFVKHGHDFSHRTDVVVSLSRDAFEEVFSMHIEEGRVLIVAWFETTSVSFGSVVLGANSSDGIATLLDEFKQHQPSDSVLEDLDL